ncbi:MAG: hypothetical protein N2445_06285, partial [Acidobacteria bacterium]|nr:hypothetical protein [Acidobacteriota bacterium]
MKRLIFVFFFFLSFFINVFSQGRNEKIEKNLVTSKEEVRIGEEGELLSPLISPSGKYLAFTKDNYKGIFILDIEQGKTIVITDIDGSGFGCEWQGYEDLLAFRGSIGNLRKKHFIAVAHPDGTIEVSSPLLQSVSLPVWINKDIAFAIWGEKEVLKVSGPAKNESCKSKVILPAPEGNLVRFDNDKIERERSEKIFFLPRYSKDGRKFLVHSLDGGIYLGFTEEGKLTKIGEGSNARFARDGNAVVFEKSK